MKVYSSDVDAFSDEDRTLLSNLARSAAALLGHIQASDLPQRISAELKTSMTDRDNVIMARGILMERHGVDNDTAMRQLIDLATSAGTSIGDQALMISERRTDSGSGTHISSSE